MATSSRAQAAMIASHPNAFNSVIEVDEHTVVPDAGAWRLAAAGQAAVSDLSPRYVLDRRELWLGGFMLLHFSRSAENQEPILKAFEEEREQNGGVWPAKIFDPLPGGCGDPAKRLQNAVYALNKGIIARAAAAGAPYSLQFCTDEMGQAVSWKIVTD